MRPRIEKEKAQLAWSQSNTINNAQTEMEAKEYRIARWNRKHGMLNEPVKKEVILWGRKFTVDAETAKAIAAL